MCPVAWVSDREVFDHRLSHCMHQGLALVEGQWMPWWGSVKFGAFQGTL